MSGCWCWRLTVHCSLFTVHLNQSAAARFLSGCALPASTKAPEVPRWGCPATPNPASQASLQGFGRVSSGHRHKKVGTLGTNPKNARKLLSPLNKVVPKTTGDKSILSGDTGDSRRHCRSLTSTRPAVWCLVQGFPCFFGASEAPPHTRPHAAGQPAHAGHWVTHWPGVAEHQTAAHKSISKIAGVTR
jgi:hypothetical protein